MNQDTLWLQVPAAKTYPANKFKSSDKLEKLANKLASLQGYESPHLDRINITLFAADHGISDQLKTPLTQTITSELLSKYSSSSDTHHLFNEKLNSNINIINLGTRTSLKHIDGIINSTIASKTHNFCHSPAMSSEQLAKAVNTGRQLAQRVNLSDTKLFVAGEINISNKISATAMACALLHIKPENLTNIDHNYNKKELNERNKLIHQSLHKHATKLTSPLEILRHLGSFEIAALTGSYLCCAHSGVPVLINSLAAAVAALVTSRLCPDAEKWFLFSDLTGETAYKKVIKTLNAQPLLQLDTHIDSVANIAISLSLLKLACASHNQLTIFSNENLLKKYS